MEKKLFLVLSALALFFSACNRDSDTAGYLGSTFAVSGTGISDWEWNSVGTSQYTVWNSLNTSGYSLKADIASPDSSGTVSYVTLVSGTLSGTLFSITVPAPSSSYYADALTSLKEILTDAGYSDVSSLAQKKSGTQMIGPVYFNLYPSGTSSPDGTIYQRYLTGTSSSYTIKYVYYVYLDQDDTFSGSVSGTTTSASVTYTMKGAVNCSGTAGWNLLVREQVVTVSATTGTITETWTFDDTPSGLTWIHRSL